jgi:hypothetical protein
MRRLFTTSPVAVRRVLFLTLVTLAPSGCALLSQVRDTFECRPCEPIVCRKDAQGVWRDQSAHGTPCETTCNTDARTCQEKRQWSEAFYRPSCDNMEQAIAQHHADVARGWFDVCQLLDPQRATRQEAALTALERSEANAIRLKQAEHTLTTRTQDLVEAVTRARQQQKTPGAWSAAGNPKYLFTSHKHGVQQALDAYKRYPDARPDVIRQSADALAKADKVATHLQRRHEAVARRRIARQGVWKVVLSREQGAGTCEDAHTPELRQVADAYRTVFPRFAASNDASNTCIWRWVVGVEGGIIMCGPLGKTADLFIIYTPTEKNCNYFRDDFLARGGLIL